jgi:acetyl-CoA synthetase
MGYINAPDRTKNAFRGEWYLTDDTVKIDDDGYVWFIGKQDDVVKVWGYRVGPFEIESVLIRHPAVLEAAVVSFEDSVRGHIFRTFVVPKPGYKPSEELAKELLGFVRQSYSKHVHLHEVRFVNSLPKTESGKMQRFKLKSIK